MGDYGGGDDANFRFGGPKGQLEAAIKHFCGKPLPILVAHGEECPNFRPTIPPFDNLIMTDTGSLPAGGLNMRLLTRDEVAAQLRISKKCLPNR